MSSMIDSIMNAIFILGAFLILTTIVTTVVLNNTFHSAAQDQNVLFEERTNIAVDAFLLSTENLSGLSMSKLIGKSMFDLETNLSFGNDQVDIVNETRVRLDKIFGKDNYFITIKPVIKGVNLMFVLDSSNSVEAERQIIASQLGAIQETIQETIRGLATGKEEVFVQILMLPSPQNGRCKLFDELSLPNTECVELTTETLYDEINRENWVQPSFGGNSYDVWKNQNNFATTQFFAESDWAAGVAAASIRFDKDVFIKSQVSINIIFPLSDELATTSKSDACFLLADTKGAEYLICQFCDDVCPVARSQVAVDQAKVFAKERDTRVFPINSVNCDLNYSKGFNTFSTIGNAYINSFRDAGPFFSSEYPATNWCSQNACGGCSSSWDGVSADADICFHDNCFGNLTKQMNELADYTGGNVINVNDVQKIPEQILSAFETTVTTYDFKIGFRDELRDRFVYEKVVPLPNKVLGKIVLWAYTDSSRICTVEESCETLKGCPGVRACINNELNDTCIPNDPSCTGHPCEGPEFCRDGCLGTRACVGGVLADECITITSTCPVDCVDECEQEGRTSCQNIDPTRSNSQDQKLLCVYDKDSGCRILEPWKVCEEPCRNNQLCGEDPFCPYDECGESNGICTNWCSQLGDVLCYPDSDCDSCNQKCVQDNVCNPECFFRTPNGCPPDPDCDYKPGCSLEGVACNDAVGGCCNSGTAFTWGKVVNKATHPQAPIEVCNQIKPPLFSTTARTYGACCTETTDCAVWNFDGPPYRPACVSQGDITMVKRSSNKKDPQSLCAAGVAYECEVSPRCVGNTACDISVTVNGQTYTCNYETGAWE